MRAVLSGATLAALVITPSLADYYIVQEPSTKRCRIVEERPAPSVGVVIGGVGFATNAGPSRSWAHPQEARSASP
jgi:hypothetical protein